MIERRKHVNGEVVGDPEDGWPAIRARLHSRLTLSCCRVVLCTEWPSFGTGGVVISVVQPAAVVCFLGLGWLLLRRGFAASLAVPEGLLERPSAWRVKTRGGGLVNSAAAGLWSPAAGARTTFVCPPAQPPRAAPSWEDAVAVRCANVASILDLNSEAFCLHAVLCHRGAPVALVILPRRPMSSVADSAPSLTLNVPRSGHAGVTICRDPWASERSSKISAIPNSRAHVRVAGRTVEDRSQRGESHALERPKARAQASPLAGTGPFRDIGDETAPPPPLHRIHLYVKWV